jgi:cobalt-zinc-cadmium efflux system protein
MVHHHHAHNHSHHHSPINYGWAFGIAVTLNFGFVVLEIVYGNLSHSLALIGDAVHNFSDVFALLLAWGATILTQRHSTQRYTYGMKRTSILAALINSVLLVLVTGGMAWEAIQRAIHPVNVSGETIVWVAAVGIAINLVTALMFFAGRKHDLNIRGAFLHLASDAAVSLGVVIAGVLITLTGWSWLDPVVSLLIAGVILLGTWGLLKDSVNLALDSVPENIDPRKVSEHLLQLPGVVSLHDLHIWAMSTTETALTVHLVVNEVGWNDRLLAQATDDLHGTFGIEHVTVQRESGDADYPCRHCVPIEARSHS